MSFTFRENAHFLTLFGIWALITALATVTGPFGTLEHLTIIPRLGYWAAVVALSVGGSHIAFTPEKPRTIRMQCQMWGLYILGITSCVFFLNMVVFDAWHDWVKFLNLLVSVTFIVAIVHGAIWLMDLVRPEASSDKQDDPTARFLKRIPVAKRGDLIRIEAQDHYLNVITDKGSSLILLRLSEAVAELENAKGLRVHRSHWVALEAVKSHRRRQGRDFLVMPDGTEIPISRSYRNAALEVGFF